MDTLYSIIIILVFIFAIVDIIVGVSNDAINFLNSAIGSKAIPLKTILIIAGIGVLMGTVFSSGLMEVARKGIFSPELFFFDEIIVIFLAVLIADILMLDYFNSLGIPISTTVLVVFELLGASLCLALLKKYYELPLTNIALGDYINISKTTDITVGIFFSVFIAFTIGAIVQYISRIIFTFQFLKKSRWSKVIFGGVSLTSITYFILLKGVNVTSFLDSTFIELNKSNTLLIVVIGLFFWSLTTWFVNEVFRLNIFKFIIVFGTFALALAFAGNDLVNFIGVSIAAWQGFELWITAYQTSGVTPSEFSMIALSGEVKTPNYLLVIAGVVMVLTLWFSSKAQYVVQTGVNLGRQGEGEERFKANYLSQNIVRLFYNMSLFIKSITPKSYTQYVQTRFIKTKPTPQIKGITTPAFDMLRASNNLVLASILISIATNFTLPLSTTYITFMVAMGTSFGDKAWGRESAVYRVSGVLNVLGSWILTALIASTLAAFIALIIYFGKLYAVGFLFLILVFTLLRSSIKHSKHIQKIKEKKRFKRTDIITINDITVESSHNIISVINGVDKRYSELINNLGYHDVSKLRKTLKNFPTLENEIDELKDDVFYYIKSLEDDTVEASKFYLLTLDYLQEMVQSLGYLIRISYRYVNNNHRNLRFNQIRELKGISRDFSAIFSHIQNVFEQHKFEDIELLIQQKKELLEIISELIEKQIERIRTTDMGQQNSKLYFDVLLESKNMFTTITNMLNLYNEYYTEAKEEF